MSCRAAPMMIPWPRRTLLASSEGVWGGDVKGRGRVRRGSMYDGCEAKGEGQVVDSFIRSLVYL